MTCQLALFFCSANRMSGKGALFSLMALHTSTPKQEGRVAYAAANATLRHCRLCLRSIDIT